MIQKSSKEKELVPISEAAKILGVSIDTIRRWDKSGRLHSERLNGKDRYFSLEELERIKFSKSLSISEAAIQLKISPTTLRRLEKKGFINPRRTQSGERIYDGDVIRKFLESDYFIREREVKERIPELPEKHGLNEKKEELIKDSVFESKTKQLEREDSAINTENHHNILPETPAESSEKTHLVSNLKPWQRIPELLATTVVFFLLLTFGIRNVIISTAKSSNPPLASTVLSTTANPPNPSTAPAVFSTTAKSSNPSTSSAVLSTTEEAKHKMTLTVKIDDKAASVNIREKPTIGSRKIGQASDGDTFEYVSGNEEWYEIKLATRSGFISAKYIEVREGNK